MGTRTTATGASPLVRLALGVCTSIWIWPFSQPGTSTVPVTLMAPSACARLAWSAAPPPEGSPPPLGPWGWGCGGWLDGAPGWSPLEMGVSVGSEQADAAKMAIRAAIAEMRLRACIAGSGRFRSSDSKGEGIVGEPTDLGAAAQAHPTEQRGAGPCFGPLAPAQRRAEGAWAR